MRRVVLILIVSLLFLSGCRESDYISDTQLASNLSNELLALLNNRDCNGLKGVFSKDIQDTVDLEKQIEDFFVIFEGNISDSDIDFGHSSESIRDGQVTERYISAYIHIETETGRKYTIYYACYPVIERKPSMQGIYRISITTETEDEYLIGKHISMSDLE